MLNPSFKGILKEGDSKYTLVMLTAKRARQIIDGKKPLIETASTNPVTIAIEEIIDEKVRYENPSKETIK